MLPAFKWALIGITCILCSACGPSLVVRHFDPTEPSAEVRVDGKAVGTVSFGNELSVSITRGPHRINAVKPGVGTNQWSNDSLSWSVIVVKDVILTLLPPSTPSSSKDQSSTDPLEAPVQP